MDDTGYCGLGGKVGFVCAEKWERNFGGVETSSLGWEMIPQCWFGVFLIIYFSKLKVRGMADT